MINRPSLAISSHHYIRLNPKPPRTVGCYSSSKPVGSSLSRWSASKVFVVVLCKLDWWRNTKSWFSDLFFPLLLFHLIEYIKVFIYRLMHFVIYGMKYKHVRRLSGEWFVSKPVELKNRAIFTALFSLSSPSSLPASWRL